MIYILCMSVNPLPHLALTIPLAMPRKKSPPSAFGRRLEALRKARGLTQLQVAHALDTTQRTVSYYENQGGSPPAHVVIALSKLLHVSADELLGLKPSKLEHRREEPERHRLWKRFQRMTRLPERDQRAVIRLINSLVSVSGQHRTGAE
jgi:transcriptional regulator with XRE-family HTH domain